MCSSVSRHCMCFVLILVLTLSLVSVGRLTVQEDVFIRQLHFTTQPQHQVQRPVLLDVCRPIVSCHRPLNLYPQFLHISHRENGSFEVLSLHPVGYNRPPSAVNDLAVTK